MPEEAADTTRPTRPDPVELVPTMVVQHLVARAERELTELQQELESLLGEADATEKRVRAEHPALEVYDEDFEAQVLEEVGHWTGRRGFAAISAALADPPLEARRADRDSVQRDAEPEPSVPAGQAVPFEATAPVPIVENDLRSTPNGSSGTAPGHGARDPGADVGAEVDVTTPTRPRTTVVDRRSRRSLPAGARPAVTQEPASAADTEPTESQFASFWGEGKDSADVPARTRRAKRSRLQWAAKVPSRLLIQLGLLVVVVGLLVLKLG